MFIYFIINCIYDINAFNAFKYYICYLIFLQSNWCLIDFIINFIYDIIRFMLLNIIFDIYFFTV